MKQDVKILLFIAIMLNGLFLNTNAQKKITMEDIYRKGTFSQRTISGLESLKDGEHYTRVENFGKNIVKYSYETGEKTENLFVSTESGIENFDAIVEYQFSEDESKILLGINYESIYRHSFKAEYYIYDIKSKTSKKLSENGKQQLASFSPNGTMVSFVRDNNIFVKNIINDENEIQLTTDGKFNEIINGAPDWVYEEEFSFSKAYEWSNDSKKIIFLKSDESKVKMYSLQTFGKLYPENYDYKYPKAGEENSKVSVHIVDINTKNIIEANIGDKNDIYIPRIMFTQAANLAAVIKLNRLQNKYELFLIDANSGNSNVILTINDEKYIEINDDLKFLKDNKNFILSNETSGYRHLYLYDINGKLIRQITRGDWEVTNFYGIDEKTETLFFQAAKSTAINREIFSVNINGENLTNLSVKIGTNNAEFSSNFKFFINRYTDANTPLFITLNDNKGKIIREIETNQNLNKKISTEGEFPFAKKEFFKITTEDGTELNAWMIKPLDFKKSKKYPVLMYVYGGPGNQTVLNAWDRDMSWWQMLTQKGYIIVSVDNRGTGSRGKDFKQTTYKQLGKYEVQDQISVAKFLGTQKYIDKDRIGIFGWSYGGYMSSLCMTIGADYFKAGIAVAPVTNWRFYDSIYTERYNGLPQDNKSGYDDNSPVNHAKEMKGKFLLVHGTADDNVHFQNSIEFVDKLIANDVQFQTMYYPNNDHGIYFGNSRFHLYTMMTNFIEKNL
ncbi:MAG: S9 family peptidase [Bacteroidales bacterium]|jgi:dipeptidyl-peptidase-4|nr:S9 family peptidase [Bacteroidales bacterium]